MGKFKPTKIKSSQKTVQTRVDKKEQDKEFDLKKNRDIEITQNKNKILEFYQIHPHYFWIFISLLATFIAYYSVLDNDFVNWDDDRYVTLNLNIRELSLNSIIKFFSSYYFVLYLPLSILSYAIDYKIAGLNPFIYHFFNVIFHLINTGLVYVFIKNLLENNKVKNITSIAFITSLLFGITTFHVQSVAWVSERKDVLYSMFFLWSMIIYLKYLKEKKIKFYVCSLLIFLLALFSKGQAVALALSLIAIDYFHGRNLFDKKVILEKIPFFILALIFGIINIKAYATQEPFAESTAALIPIPTRTFIENILYSCYGYVITIVKSFIPYKLAVINPYPEKVDGAIAFYFWLYLIPVLCCIAALIYFYKKSKEIVFGLAFYSFNIILILQIIADQPFIIAEHYSYISSIGILYLAGWYGSTIYEKYKIFKIPIIAVFGIYSIFLIINTSNRNNVWQNSQTLWDDLIEKYPSITISHYNRGNYMQEQGDKVNTQDPQKASIFYKEAIKNYDNAISLDDKHVGAFSNRGITKAKIGDTKNALADFDKVVKLDSNYANVYSNRGNAKVLLGDLYGSLSDYNKALIQKPDYQDALFNRANVRMQMGDFTGAIADYDLILIKQPDNINAIINKGFSLLNSNKIDEAILFFNRAVQMDTKNYNAYYYRAFAYEKKGISANADADFKTAIQLNPKLIKNIIENASRLENLGRTDDAFKEYNKAIRLDPTNADIFVNRGVFYGKRGDMKNAILDFTHAINLNPGNSSAYTNRGFAKDNSGDYSGAIEDYGKAIQLSPEFWTAYSNRGILYKRLNKYNEAIGDFNAAIKLRPDIADPYYNRALVYLSLNQKLMACDDFKKALQLGMNIANNQLTKYCK
jgi:protein O-mannosyl-transferase